MSFNSLHGINNLNSLTTINGARDEYGEDEFDKGIQWEIEEALKKVSRYTLKIMTDKLAAMTDDPYGYCTQVTPEESLIQEAAQEIRMSVYKLSKKMLEREVLKAGLDVDADAQTPQK